MEMKNKRGDIVEKGEISHYKPFLLLQQYFQSSSAAEASECISYTCSKTCCYSLLIHTRCGEYKVYTSLDALTT